MGNIVDFNNSDGLPPTVVQKLNNNFWHVVKKIIEPSIVVVAGSTAPNPRTDETLFYNTDTGELYIWNQYENTWGWNKIDIGYIHVDQHTPMDSTYTRKGEVLWVSLDYSTLSPIYIWSKNVQTDTWEWIPLETFIVNVVSDAMGNSGPLRNDVLNIVSLLPIVYTSFTKAEWLAISGFTDAVQDIIDSQ